MILFYWLIDYVVTVAHALCQLLRAVIAVIVTGRKLLLYNDQGG